MVKISDATFPDLLADSSVNKQTNYAVIGDIAAQAYLTYFLTPRQPTKNPQPQLQRFIRNEPCIQVLAEGSDPIVDGLTGVGQIRKIANQFRTS